MVVDSKGVVSALNCEDFESFFSDYIDETLDSWTVGHLQDHLSFCSACGDTLAGMRQVRMALHNLGGTGPSAGFKLRLNNRLQEEVYRESWTWLRPVAWGFALAAAMAILLWPTSATLEAADSTMPFKEGPAWAVPVADRQLGRAWTEQFPELVRPQRHAHIRPVSF